MLSQPLPYIFDLGIADPQSHLSQYSGTTRCDGATAATFGYEPDALLPRGLPRSFPEDCTRFTHCAYGKLPISCADFIGVINVEAAMEPLLELGVREARSVEDMREIKAGARYPAAINELIGKLETCLEFSGPVSALDVTIKAPGLPTVTVNNDTGLRVGLHVDSWDRGKSPDRARARNRINMNFGREPRHFLLINTSLQASAILLHHEFGSYDRVARFVREILEQTPSLEVVRIQINPGEAYIAPTDNIIHDATTLDMRQVDISMSVLGRLAFRKDSIVKVLMPSDGKVNSS